MMVPDQRRRWRLAPGASLLESTSRRAIYEQILAPFQPNNGDLLSALHAVQECFGWVDRESVDAVSRKLRLNASTVFGALSFYAEFRTSPPARLTIHWCSGPACRLKGGDNIRRALETVLGLGMEEVSPDGAIGLHVQQCDGSCEASPCLWMLRRDEHGDGPYEALQHHRGEVVGPLTVSDAITLARSLKAGGGEP
jgi:NADH:ubiquinone oxidoreductase subunit E